MDGSLIDADASKGSIISSSPELIKKKDAVTAYRLVLEKGGTSFPVRDTVDRRLLNDVKNRTGKIIKSQEEVGGWPTLNTVPAPTDTDGDGMPDLWETANGFKPKDASDRNGDHDSDGYTNLEEYLNGLVAGSILDCPT